MMRPCVGADFVTFLGNVSIKWLMRLKNVPSASARWASKGQSITLLPMKNMAISNERIIIAQDQESKPTRSLVLLLQVIIKGIMRAVGTVIKSISHRHRLIQLAQTSDAGIESRRTSGTPAISIGRPANLGVTHWSKDHQQSGSECE